MESILEKITLYDILGYLLSGCFLEIIICLEYILEKWISTDGMLMQQKEALEQFNSFFIVAFIVGGYCLGVILSEGSMLIEYSCAVTPQIRQTGNRLSGNAGTAYASLLA